MSLEEAQEAALEEHNRLRALHEDTKPLELCADPCEEAQVRIWTLASFFFKNILLKAYAELLMEEDRFDHSTGRVGVGENLASATGHRTLVEEAERATKSWYNEHSAYDYENPVFDATTGHFTQVNG